ncbi:uncharacterized protein LOC125856066 [Solanum stenotomum]|uniref:uncharacterized protein LOC125856066 n=1 Tax=Solanum stenotomum TaxID=172797 RepID=UPI0020D0F87D|nr:uncharacterized protein LOC125856066 [Solanum stenotomum]
MSVREYALRFTQLSKYSPSIGADRRAKMSKFVSGVSDLVVKECRTDMLVHDMDISRLMVHAQQIEEEKLKERSKEVKRDKVDDGNYFHARSGGRGRSRFQQSSPGKVLQVIFRGQEMRGCDKMDHKIRDCPFVAKNDGDTHRRAQPYPSSGPGSSSGNAPKQNRFYAL